VPSFADAFVRLRVDQKQLRSDTTKALSSTEVSKAGARAGTLWTRAFHRAAATETAKQARSATGVAKGIAGGAGPGLLGLSAVRAGLLGLGGAGLGALPAVAALGGVGAVAGLGVGVLSYGAHQLIGTKTHPGALFAPAQRVSKAFQSTISKATTGLIGPLRQTFAQLPGIIHKLAPAMHALFAGAATLLKPLVSGLADMAKVILPLLGQAFRAVAPSLGLLLHGIASLMRGLLPGLIVLLRAAGPAVKVFVELVTILGKTLGGLFRSFAPVIRQSSLVLSGLAKIVGSVLAVVGKLAVIMAKALGPVFVQVAGLVRGLNPLIVIIGRLIAGLARAILGDLGAALKAVVQLIRLVSPGLNVLVRALSGVFKVLENSGVFAILANALESIVPLIAMLVNTLLKGLAPILGPVIKLVAQLAGIAVQVLVTALKAVLPLLIMLAKDILVPLVPLVQALLPLIGLLGKLLGIILVAAIKLLAPVLGLLVKLIGYVSDALTWLTKGILWLTKNWRQAWADIKQWALDAWNFLTHGWGQYLVPGLTLIRAAISFLAHHWRQIWGEIKSVALGFWNWLYTSFIGPQIKVFTVTLPAAFRTAVALISKAWGAIKTVLLPPVRFVIDRLVDGLISAFDWISSKLGGPTIAPIHPFGLARGGRVPGYGGGDKHPALLEGGEAVIDKGRTRWLAPLFGAIGVPGFAAGGRAGNPRGAHPGGFRPPGFLRGLADFGKITAAIFSGNSTALAHAITDLIGGGASGATGVLAGILTAVPHALINAAVHFILNTFGGHSGHIAAGGVPGNVGSYRNVVLRVLGMLRQPGADLGVVLRQMTTESGGNPTAVNRWDSNWLAGHPSVGLMQLIRGTFAAYAGPYRNIGPFEYGVSVNPLANIYAGLNYAIHRYGGGWTRVLGQGHGYARGTGMAGLAENIMGIGLASGMPYSLHKGEQVTSLGGMAVLARLLAELIDAVQQNADDTATGLAQVLGVAADRAGRTALYSAR